MSASRVCGDLPTTPARAERVSAPAAHRGRPPVREDLRSRGPVVVRRQRLANGQNKNARSHVILQVSQRVLPSMLHALNPHRSISSSSSAAEMYSPFASKCATSLARNASFLPMVSVSHTRQQCLLARVTATFIRLASPKPDGRPPALLLTAEMMIASSPRGPGNRPPCSSPPSPATRPPRVNRAARPLAPSTA